MNKRNRAKTKYKHSPPPGNLLKYKVLRNKCNQLIRATQRDYIYNSVNNSNSKLWFGNFWTPWVQSWSQILLGWSGSTHAKHIASVNSNAIGCDWLSYKMISLALDLSFFSTIINYSLSSGSSPFSWRTAYVILIPKITNPTYFSHYCPLSRSSLFYLNFQNA